MYAIAFDLVVADTERHYPKNVGQAYADIGAILGEHGFHRVQGSLYVTENEDMARLFMAMQALKSHAWFPKSVRDIRAFRIEQWSDFTMLMKTLVAQGRVRPWPPMSTFRRSGCRGAPLPGLARGQGLCPLPRLAGDDPPQAPAIVGGMVINYASHGRRSLVGKARRWAPMSRGGVSCR